MDRRSFLRTSAAGATALAFGPGFWRAALAAPAIAGDGPYGPLLAPDANGVRLPEGFTSRVVAVSGQPVGASGYTWHGSPDGAATYPADDGGWYHAVNSEQTPGGVGVLRFAPDGTVVDAYRVLDGTRNNCAGGWTPWGTWLSCEETFEGLVYECDPTQPGQGVARTAMGAFNREAVAVDPERQQLFQTEDLPFGKYYRFTPDAYPELSSGTLEAAIVSGDGSVTWVPVPDPTRQATAQVGAATSFNGGEGIWYDPAEGGWMYFTTKGDNRVWYHDLANDVIDVLYDADDFDEPPLTGVDNVVVANSGDVIVGEDGGNLELVLIAADTRETAPIMRLEGPEHDGSEITGPCFSPDGTRLYFSSQRGGTVDGGVPGSGVTFEIAGPFRQQRVGVAAIGATTPAPVPQQQPEQPDPAPEPTPDPAGDTEAEPLPATGAGAAAAGLGAIAAAAALRRRGGDTNRADRG